MAIQLPALPYSSNALEPYISMTTIEFHYGKHHSKYISKLNEVIKDTRYVDMSLDDIVLESFGVKPTIFNNAGQAWNHNFYWQCLAPAESSSPSDICLEHLKASFHSLHEFKRAFTDSAKRLFGSGWTWLVRDTNGLLTIRNLPNAKTPIVYGQIPIFVCDLWEHAYYLDYQHERDKYLNNFWNVVNWGFLEKNLALSIHTPASARAIDAKSFSHLH